MPLGAGGAPPPHAAHDRAIKSKVTNASALACRPSAGLPFAGRWPETAAPAANSASIPAHTQLGKLGSSGATRGAPCVRAVVTTCTFTKVAEATFNVTELWLSEHLDACGAPLQAKLTVPVSPPPGARLKLYVAVPPAVTVAEVENPSHAATEKSSPLPESATVCGLFWALSVMVSVPVRPPAAVGVKVTLIVQLALAATLEPHVFVSAKSPLAAMPLIVNAALPVFVRVMLCAELVVACTWPANISLVAETPTIGPRPVPLRLTICGLSEALSVSVTIPVKVPLLAGEKIALMVHVEPGFRVAGETGQVLLWAKLLLATMPRMVRFAPPVFVTATVSAALVVPTAESLKDRLMVERDTTGTRVTSRMRLLPVSAMKRRPELWNDTPSG